jgi:anti-anti-sigma regulatory factor
MVADRGNYLPPAFVTVGGQRFRPTITKGVSVIPVRSARRLDALEVTEQDGHRVIDLAEVSFLDPVHLVGVAAAAQLAHRQGSRLRLTGLTEEQAYYAARMHLGRLIEQFGGEHTLPSVRERDLHDSLLEVQPLATERDVRDLTALVYRRVYGHDPEVAHALYVALAEVGSNVCDHAQSIGFMAAQTIAEHGVLRFAVADAGVGLLGTLTGRGATDDRTALNMALSGTSRSDLPGHGTGLPRTVDIVSALGGEILLASGSAATRATGRGRQHHQLADRFTGTIFEGAVPATVGRHRSGRLYEALPE